MLNVAICIVHLHFSNFFNCVSRVHNYIKSVSLQRVHNYISEFTNFNCVCVYIYIYIDCIFSFKHVCLNWTDALCLFILSLIHSSLCMNHLTFKRNEF